MSDTTAAEAAAAPAGSGTKSLASGGGLEYRAFARQVEGIPGWVVTVVASCYYPVSGFVISFEGSTESGLTLMQEEPKYHYDLTDFVSASWAPGSVLPPERPQTVHVTDAFGTHTITVEDWGG
ncbi:MAG TPA: hypothetical protein VFR81_01350 [Longimicrobium sp.]|nr:hypothetical protein [Longimicrobium sp.]